MAEQNRIMMIYSIIGRGKSKRYMETLNSKNIRFHYQTTAFGTAPSEMLDLFGLGSSDKDVVISLAPEKAVRSFMAELGKNIGRSAEYGGLMITLRTSAINRVSAEVINRVSSNGEKGERDMKDNKNRQQLILVVVDQGYTDQVMQTAKRAGAMGGTILRARFAATERLEQLGEFEAQNDKEIISILAPASNAAQIMEEVNREHGALSEAHGTVLALPVDKAYKI